MNTYDNNLVQKIKNQSNMMFVLSYLSSVFTILGGVMHFIMLGPSLKPVNFPMEMLPYTDSLFLLSGIAQIFWAIPMIMRWSSKWYYIGIIGTTGLIILLALTRIPNIITINPLIDINPMAMYTEVVQILYVVIAIIILIIRKTQDNKRNKMKQKI